MSRVFGFLDLSEIRKNAPEGANLYLDFGDGDLVQDIVYYKLTKKRWLALLHRRSQVLECMQ